MPYYSYSATVTPDILADLTLGTLIGLLLVTLGLAIIVIVAEWKIFSKAGEPGWACIVPFYNMYVLYKITWGKGWFFLLLFVPILNIIMAIMTMHKLSTCFGHDIGFTLGLIFLPIIFFPMLAFGSSQYTPPLV